MPPLVSVVVPVRDRERCLGEAIGSLLHGGWEELEVIVVDDGSTDGSAEVAERFPAVRCLRQPPRGAAAARNAGIAAARGAVFGFLDSDDLRVPGSLGRQVAELERRPEVGLLFGRVVELAAPPAAGADLLPGRVRGPARPGYLAGAMLARRLAFGAVGGFDETLRAGEFVDWMARARLLGVRSALIGEVVLWRRAHGGDHLSARGDARRDFTRVVKANLERRRALKGEG